MSEISVNLNINCDLNDLVREIGGGISGSAFSDQNFPDGSRFISSLENGVVISAYNHPTKWHSATAEGGIGGKTGRSQKPPGEWAIAKGFGILAGRKAFYNSW